MHHHLRASRLTAPLVLLLATAGAAVTLAARPANAADDSASFSSDDGLISVQPPSDDAWSCLQSRQLQDDGAMTMVKCRRTGAGEFFFLTARDYEVTERDAKKDAEELSKKDYKRDYERLYTKVDYVKSEPVQHRGRPAWEVLFEAQHDRMGSVRKRERIVVEGGHVLVLSAEGMPELFERLQDESEQWFLTTEFASLPASGEAGN